MDRCFLYTSALRFDPSRSDPGFGADVVMIDLEDAVHASAKDDARARLASLDLRPLVARGLRFGVRVNALSTIEGLRDLDAVHRGVAGGALAIDYLQPPKVGSREEVAICRSIAGAMARPLRLFPIVETPEGVDDVEAIARESDLLLFGQADVTAAMYRPNEAWLAQARGRFCVACARARIYPVDTKLFEEIQDMSRFEAGCRDAQAEGFMAKAIVHPRQVPVVKRVFAVDPTEIARHRATIADYERADAGFRIVDGAVIAPPFVAKARRMLELYGALEAPPTDEEKR